MIDTDKYEGYSEDEWILVDDKCIVMNIKTGNVAAFDTRYVKISQPDMNLILDAPLLLEEVKRLRQVMIYVEQRQPHPALEMALKQGLYLSEIRERIE